MRAVVQRVSQASVTVDGNVTGSAKKGLLILLGVGKGDTEKEVRYMADKIVNLRIFEDENDKMNLSLADIGGDLLVVSQFTLYGDVRKGRRPGFDGAAPPDVANDLYEKFVAYCKSLGIPTETGVFQAHMMVDLTNNGPVTILLDSDKTF